MLNVNFSHYQALSHRPKKVAKRLTGLSGRRNKTKTAKITHSTEKVNLAVNLGVKLPLEEIFCAIPIDRLEKEKRPSIRVLTSLTHWKFFFVLQSAQAQFDSCIFCTLLVYRATLQAAIDFNMSLGNDAAHSKSYKRITTLMNS